MQKPCAVVLWEPAANAMELKVGGVGIVPVTEGMDVSTKMSLVRSVKSEFRKRKSTVCQLVKHCIRARD